MKCRSCHAEFSDFSELAKHITVKKDRAHRGGKKWAANYLLQTRRLNSKKELPEKRPYTEGQKEAFQSAIPQLSGSKVVVASRCPSCSHIGHKELEIEYANSQTAWRDTDGCHRIMCRNCINARRGRGIHLES